MLWVTLCITCYGFMVVFYAVRLKALCPNTMLIWFDVDGLLWLLISLREPTMISRTTGITIWIRSWKNFKQVLMATWMMNSQVFGISPMDKGREGSKLIYTWQGKNYVMLFLWKNPTTLFQNPKHALACTPIHQDQPNCPLLMHGGLRTFQDWRLDEEGTTFSNELSS